MGIVWEFMEQYKYGLLHNPQIKGIFLLLEKEYKASRKMWLGWDGSRDDPWKGSKNQGLLDQGKKICSSFKSKELLQIKPTGKS